MFTPEELADWQEGCDARENGTASWADGDHKSLAWNYGWKFSGYRELAMAWFHDRNKPGRNRTDAVVYCLFYIGMARKFDFKGWPKQIQRAKGALPCKHPLPKALEPANQERAGRIGGSSEGLFQTPR